MKKHEQIILPRQVFNYELSEAISRPAVSGIKMNLAAGPDSYRVAVYFNNIPTTSPHYTVPYNETRLKSRTPQMGK
jgi:hypothetical protein